MNSRLFWGSIRKNTFRIGIFCTIHFDKKISIGSESISCFFSFYFSTVYGFPSSNKIPEIPFSHFTLPNNYFFSIYDVELDLFEIITIKSTGLDGLL